MNARQRQDEQGKAGSTPAPIQDGRRDVAVVDHQIDSRDLFVATREITIAHGEDIYRLRLTAQNKLILTK
jgi:hemin uptake protein HemP